MSHPAPPWVSATFGILVMLGVPVAMVGYGARHPSPPVTGCHSPLEPYITACAAREADSAGVDENDLKMAALRASTAAADTLRRGGTPRMLVDGHWTTPVAVGRFLSTVTAEGHLIVAVQDGATGHGCWVDLLPDGKASGTTALGCGRIDAGGR